MKRVIVIGNNHHNTLGLVRSLGHGGYDVFCLIVDSCIRHSFVLMSSYVKWGKLFTDFSSMFVYLQNDIHFTERVPLFTTSDAAAEFVDNHYYELSTRYFLNNCGRKEGQLGYWMDKERMLLTAKDCGLLVPNSVYLSVLDGENVRVDIPFPCLIKPQKSSRAGKENVFICRDSKQLRSAVADQFSKGIDVVVQECINKEYEFLIMGMRSARTGCIILPGGLHKLRTCKKTKNMGMMSYAYTTPDIPNVIDKRAIEEFLEAIDYDGVFSVEFMIVKDKAYFLEINLRNDGTQFCFEGAGVNLPVLWAKSVMGEGVSSFNQKLEEKYCMVEVNYLKNLDWRYIPSAFKELRRTDLFALVDKKDWKPALYKLLYAIK